MDNKTLVIDVQETIRFFDEVPDYSYKQAPGIIAVAGEDLAVGCFQKHLEAQRATVCVRHIENGDSICPEPVTTGKKRGPRLDRWVVVDWPDKGRTVFQAEIKNSAAHGWGGKTICLNASAEKLRAYSQREWNGLWDPESQSLRGPENAKVLVPMKPPDDLSGEHILPLFICWTPVAPESEQDNFLFKVATRPSPTCGFNKLWVFSISSYLRSLEKPRIALKMPVAAAKLHTLNRLFQQSLEAV